MSKQSPWTFVLDKPGLALVCAPGSPATVAVDAPQRRTMPVLPPYRLAAG
jgi:hypothetical protein